MLNQALAEDLVMVANWLMRRTSNAKRDVAANLADFAALDKQCPSIALDLIAHPIPASHLVQWEVLISQFPAELMQGCLRLAWQAESGLPWSVEYADHWAANLVLTVNGENTSIQSALLYLNATLKAQPQLMEILINRSVVAAHLQTMDPALLEVGEERLNMAVERFRRSQHLHSADAMRRWLNETQLTMDAVYDLVRCNVQAEILKEHIAAPQISAFFAEHQQEYETLTVFVMQGLAATDAQNLAARWRASGICPIFAGSASADGVDGAGGAEGADGVAGAAAALPANLNGKLETVYSGNVLPVLANAATGEVIGPFQIAANSERMALAYLVQRQPARLDQRCRQAITERLFNAWLREQRQQAKVHWHWM